MCDSILFVARFANLLRIMSVLVGLEIPWLLACLFVKPVAKTRCRLRDRGGAARRRGEIPHWVREG